MQSTRRLTSLTRLLLRPQPHTSLRGLSTTSPLHSADQKAAQHDRNKMNVEPNEYSKSGTDTESAANEKAAFERGAPKPEQAREKASQGNDISPLNASPANPELSKGTSEEEGGLPKKMSEGGGGRDGGGDATGDKTAGSST